MPEPHGGAYEDFPFGPESFAAGSSNISLSALFRAAVKHAQDRIDYFDSKAFACSRTARRIRFWSLVFFAFGTLSPVFASLVTKLSDAYGGPAGSENFFNQLAKLPLTEIGFVLLAFAGALVIFDRFFDSSGSWIRFRQAQAHLEVLLSRLRFKWAALMSQSGGAIAATAYVSPGLGAQCTDLLVAFVDDVENFAENETNLWAAKFQAAIDQFDSQMKNAGAKSAGDGAASGAAQGAAAAAGPQKDGAAAAAKTGGSAPQTIDVRIFVPDASTLDAGSLKLAVDDKPQTVDPGGYAEVSLTVGASYALTASGSRAGGAVSGNLRLMPSINQQNAVLAIPLK